MDSLKDIRCENCKLWYPVAYVYYYRINTETNKKECWAIEKYYEDQLKDMQEKTQGKDVEIKMNSGVCDYLNQYTNIDFGCVIYESK